MKEETCGKENIRAESTSLVRAIHILEYLAKAGQQVGLNTMAKELKISKPTLVRQLSTFKAYGFVSQDPKTKYYGLGWALIHIGNAAYQIFDLPKTLHPYVEKLSIETKESASLLIMRNGKAINVDHVLSPHNILGGIRGAGTEMQLSCSASGKLFLSFLPDSERMAYINDMPTEGRTPNSITSPKALLEELQLIRQQGYSLDNEEYEIGCRSLAAPIYYQPNKIAATISITAPVGRLSDEALPRLVQIIKSVASEASSCISFPEV